jgi:hypothetical protein
MRVTKATFRLLLLIAIAAMAIAVWGYFATRSNLPPELQSYFMGATPLTSEDIARAVDEAAKKYRGDVPSDAVPVSPGMGIRVP